MTNISYSYEGDELSLFKHAIQWKKYFAKLMMPHLGEHILEVGAGMGGTTVLLKTKDKKWVSLEPDQALTKHPDNTFSSIEGLNFTLLHSTIEDVRIKDILFDTILYIDVLEHIEKDSLELDLAAKLLSVGGKLIVLSPAHSFLYSPFDKSIGHYRRYNEKTLCALTPRSMSLATCQYLDSVGMLASLANRIILKSKMPTQKQILTWDRLMIPLSRVLDKWLNYRLGKSIMMVWIKN